MYDFYFGASESIDNDPKKWLLTVKRMLPRWVNGVPDSEFLALYDELDRLDKEKLFSENKNSVLVETGCGATTIVLLYFAMKWDVELYTWDTSSNKLAYLRGVLNDTLMRHFSKMNLFQSWKYIAFDSKSEYVGIASLSEMNKTVLACFFDSDHTWDNLRQEVVSVCPFLANGALVAIDDGNYRYQSINTAYVNMIRAKLGLEMVKIENNECAPFWEEVEKVLTDSFKRVDNLEGGSYRINFEKDIFWSYYGNEREATASLGMEKMDELAHRFDAWRVYK
jgi:hypothetical protein